MRKLVEILDFSGRLGPILGPIASTTVIFVVWIVAAVMMFKVMEYLSFEVVFWLSKGDVEVGEKATGIVGGVIMAVELAFWLFCVICCVLTTGTVLSAIFVVVSLLMMRCLDHLGTRNKT